MYSAIQSVPQAVQNGGLCVPTLTETPAPTMKGPYLMPLPRHAHACLQTRCAITAAPSTARVLIGRIWGGVGRNPGSGARAAIEADATSVKKSRRFIGRYRQFRVQSVHSRARCVPRLAGYIVRGPRRRRSLGETDTDSWPRQ